MLRTHCLRGIPLLAAIVLGLLFLVPGFVAQAQGNDDSTVTPQSTGAIITVDSTADTADDDDECTLREAITNANNNDQTDSTDCAPGSLATSTP